MTELYVNNFRGFRNTFIPIDKVNFLIGENSTGKTSILKLIRVLSDERFWDDLDLNASDFHFGYFFELCKEEYFEIAVIKQRTSGGYSSNEDSFEYFTAIKMKFTNDEGIAKVTDVRILIEEFDTHFYIKNGGVEFSYERKENLTKSYSEILEWITKNQFEGKTYQRGVIEREGGIILYDIIREFNLNMYNMKVPLFSSMIKLSKRAFRSKDVVWLAPIRAKPERAYDNYKIKFSPDGNHIPFLLKNLLPNGVEEEERIDFEYSLNKFGKRSGLFEKIWINVLSNAQIEVRILIGDTDVKISEAGYGVSQVLPLIIEILAKDRRKWYAIQQPEIHLHPRGQAAFGELIYDTQKADNKTFIIETHSDYIVDRFRLCVHKDKEETADEFQVLFFERTNDGNRVTPIKIQSNGKYADNQPQSFQEFFIKEQLELIKL